MRDFIWIFAVLGFAWLGFHSGYKTGRNDGHYEERRRYESIIADRVDEGVKGFRRVQAIIEQSEYNRGKEACHD